MRIVGIDWSGRRTGEERHLWLAEIVDGEPGRLWGASRVEAEAALLEMAADDSELVVGFDFAFSLCDWFLAQEGITRAFELWRDEARLEGWLRECPSPFWGRPGRSRPPDLEQQRLTERRAGRPTPKSVFQIGGAGSVGTGSLRGMPVLARLQQAGFRIWPFDDPGLPLVVELWPRHFTVPPIVKSRATARSAYPGLPRRWRNRTDASEDAFDAAVAALGMQRHLGDLLDLPAVTDPVVRREGWIWGVPLPVPLPVPPESDHR